MAPGPLALIALLLVALPPVACGGSPGQRWRQQNPDFVRHAPAAGQSLPDAVAALEQPGSSPRIRVTGMRLLAVDQDPWRVLDPDSVLELRPGPDERHAVIALRSCRWRQGLRRPLVPRASWLLFRGGRLVAFDAWEFGGSCEPEHLFLPTPADEARLERDLSRDMVRREPAAELGPAETFRKGLAYLEVGRNDDASRMLERGKILLSEARKAAQREEPDALSETELEAARTLRVELRRAIRDARGLPEDPAERFWRGR